MDSYGHLYVHGMDMNVHLLTKGEKEGPPLIFLPGITSYSHSFAEILKKMPERYYSLSMDIRGRGETVGSASGYRLKDYVDDLLNVVNALISNPTPPILIGHSMGARIAAAFGSQYSSLISGMVLIDPPINGPGQRDVYPNPLEMFLEQKKAVDEGKLDLFGSYFPSFNEAQVTQRADEYRNVTTEAIIESYASLLAEPFQVYVKMTTCPILLLAAEQGDTIREEELIVLKTIQPKLQAERIRDVGHMIYKEAPDLTASYILSFINDLT